MKSSIGILLSGAAMVGILAGCASQKQAPQKSGFLSQYHHLTPVDDTTSRYVNAARLASYNKFKISTVNVLLSSYNGKPITPEQQQKISDYIRASITAALNNRYPVVDTPSADTGEIRVAVTDAYKSGNRLGISVEGEILDSYSAVQVAAVVRTDLGEVYMGDWWDSTSARAVFDNWSQRLLQVIESAHRR